MKERLKGVTLIINKSKWAVTKDLIKLRVVENEAGQ